MYNKSFSVKCAEKDGLIILTCDSGKKKTEMTMNKGNLTLSQGSDTKLSLMDDGTFNVTVKKSTFQISKDGEIGILSSKGGTLDIGKDVVLGVKQKIRLGDLELKGAKIKGPTININSNAIKVTGTSPSMLQSKIKRSASASASKLSKLVAEIESLKKKEQTKAKADIAKKDTISKVKTAKQAATNLILKAKLFISV